MTDAQDELWRDVSIILKHIRFIVALLVAALIVAALTGLAAGSDGRAKSEAEIKIETGAFLLGSGQAMPTLDTIADLAESDEVAAQVAQKLGTEPEEISDNLFVDTQARNPSDRQSLDQFSVEVTGPSQRRAEQIAAAVMDAVVERAEQLKLDPEGVESLRQLQALAQQRLQELDQADVSELAQVRSDLDAQRSRLTSLKAGLSVLYEALALVRADPSRPLGELVVAVSGVLGGAEGTGGVEQASSVEELERGLELRRQLTESLIEPIQLAIEALADHERQLVLLVADNSAALSVYTSAAQSLEAAGLAGEQTEIEVEVTTSGVNTSGSANWPARLGAAAAFGLVVGVAAAFALEFLAPHWQRWRRGNAG